MGFSLLGTGRAAPALRVTNHDLSRMLDTSDEWIRTRTGVAERRILTDETLEELARDAAQAALADAGTAPGELDLILCATVGGSYATPSLACLVQEALGAHCPALDVNAACSGFLYALDVAEGYFARKRVKRVLVVAAEALSRVTDWTDRATCVLFGDGAGAAVLGEGEDLLSLHLAASGNAQHLVIPRHGGCSPFARRPEPHPYLYMNGQEVFRFAVSAMCADLAAAIGAAGLAQDQVDFVLAHQANSRIIEAAKERLGIPAQRYLHNIERYGNTSAASIPMLLDENSRAGTFHKGDLLALCAFGGGFTSGACVLRWSK